MRGIVRPSITGCSHGRRVWLTMNGVDGKSMCGLSCSECSEGTICRCCICNSTLVSPAMPAADSQCPMFDFAEPIRAKPVSAV